MASFRGGPDGNDPRSISPVPSQDEGLQTLHSLELEKERNDSGGISRGQSLKKVLQHPEGIHQMPANSSRLVFNNYFKERVKPSFFMHIYVNPWFERVALVLIVLNAFWIGFDVDFNKDDSDVPKAVFEVGDNIFCALFFMELIVRYMAYPRTWDFFTDPDMYLWNIFDLLLVMSMVADTWVLTYIIQVEAGGMQAMSSLRLLRLLRLTRIMRLVPELGMMVTSLLAALRSVASTCILGLGIMYIFAIFFVQWSKSYGSDPKCIGEPGWKICVQEYFGTLGDAFLTLTQILTFDDTFEVVRPIMSERIEMGILLIIYMLLVCFTVLNMLIGIICDVVNEVSIQEKEKMLRTRMEDLFRHLDEDQSGFVSRDEFEANGITHLGELGIDPQLTRAAFDMLDVDGDGMITCAEFVTMIFKCLHAVETEDIMKLEASVDKLADLAGIGRDEVAILEKERKKTFTPKSSIGDDSTAEDLNAVNTSLSRQMSPYQQEQLQQQEEIKPVLERFGEVQKRLEDLQLLIEAGPLGSTAATDSTDEYYNEDNFQGLPSTPEMEGLATVLRPTLRVLTARLHALRAECKAAGLQYAGDLTGSLGAKRGSFVSLLDLRPLDEMITEVIQRLKFANDNLLPPDPALIPQEVSVSIPRDSDAGSTGMGSWRGVRSALGAAAKMLSSTSSQQSDPRGDEMAHESSSVFGIEDEAEAPAVRTGPIEASSLA
mmetsp:Transcript_46873/g.81512  ORF Transcript_46873/g.81512 Transcript_46873/m.81512 type:complete len:715 (-) Transcript_46873:139-2283(-)